MPGLSVTGVQLVVPDRTLGLPVLRALSLCTCCRQYPGAAAVFVLALSHSRISLPRFAIRVDLRIVLFEDCSAFTHVAACTLALSPYFVTTITRRLQPCRYLHNRSGCYWLEPWPGGTYTHRKAPPFSRRTALPAVRERPLLGSPIFEPHAIIQGIEVHMRLQTEVESVNKSEPADVQSHHRCPHRERLRLRIACFAQ